MQVFDRNHAYKHEKRTGVQIILKNGKSIHLWSNLARSDLLFKLSLVRIVQGLFLSMFDSVQEIFTVICRNKTSVLLFYIQNTDEKINQEQLIQGANSENDETRFSINHLAREQVVESIEENSLKKYDDLRNFFELGQ